MATARNLTPEAAGIPATAGPVRSPLAHRAVESATGWSKQREQLEWLITAAQMARGAADRGDLFVTGAGHQLVNAMYDLTECDDLYRLAQDVEFQCGERVS